MKSALNNGKCDEAYSESFNKNREMSEAFKMLERSFLIQLVYPVTNTVLPIKIKSFRLKLNRGKQES